ncbi:hypothetical protein [Erythrobacter sp. F6033]|uniref:hypothetical protein n=1 Tax=Erythrobacter sp. F6033 TaxID=2926401 RepID=UPI001FF3531D|nr:hypothetical protein [Erythrobacter sp. F6033]MCK0127537.1 hypothetical protein [Erythrobacter sp. F6033]
MKKAIFASCLAISVTACANNSLMVETPNASEFRTQYAKIEGGKSTVSVDAENEAYTLRKLNDAFFGGSTPLFNEGEGIIVRHRYVTFDEGSQVGRYLGGGLFGGGSKVVLEVTFSNQAGEELSVVRSEASVNGGFFGGSNKSGIDAAVKNIAEYAAAEFR